MPKPIFQVIDNKVVTTNCLLKKCGQCGGAKTKDGKEQCQCNCHYYKRVYGF